MTKKIINIFQCSSVIREMSAYSDFGAIKKVTPAGFSGLGPSMFCNFFFTHAFSVRLSLRIIRKQFNLIFRMLSLDMRILRQRVCTLNL